MAYKFENIRNTSNCTCEGIGCDAPTSLPDACGI